MSTSKKGPTPDDQKIKEQGNKSLDELSSDYAGKSVELELIREVSEAMEKRLEGRKKDFVEEKEKLENIHQQIWGSIDAFCDSIWKFSADHDVPGVINNYLDRPSRISSKKAVEDPEKIQYLNYQISLLTEEIKTLRENIEALDSEKKSAELKVLDDKKPKFPLQESQNNNQESMNFSMNRKKVAFQDEKKIPELPQPLEFENSPEMREECQKIELKPKSSTFSVKRKSKICENFERNLWTK
ncbi:uncharacterized protein LOC107045811 [Diachasma alloeum]|uniref:uncharacterized protein LOC107045811 n=1 Tax=Diachasma alloeum TaxID=454923 RepID=UPI0010FB25BD|nr:uncharacterized protein LOC107045811 [Diachasma alloeum]